MDFQKDIAQKILSICLVLFASLSLSAQNKVSCFIGIINNSELEVKYSFGKRTKENNLFVFKNRIPNYYLDNNDFTSIIKIRTTTNGLIDSFKLSDTIILPLESHSLSYNVKLKPKNNELLVVQSIIKQDDFSLLNWSNFLGNFQQDSLNLIIIGNRKYTNHNGKYSYQEIIESPICLNCVEGNIETEKFDVTLSFNQKMKNDSTLLTQYIKETFLALEKLQSNISLKNKEIIVLIDSINKNPGAIAHPNTIVLHLNKLDKFLLQKTLIHEYIHWIAPDLDNWLNESVAEYLALKIMLKSSLITEQEFLEKMSLKMKQADLYSDFSLYHLYRNNTSLSANENYKSLYSKGAIHAFFLDFIIQNTSNYKIALEDYILNENRSISTAIKQKILEDLISFEQKHIKDNESISYNSYLTSFGILFERNKLVAAKLKQNINLFETEGKIIIKDNAKIEGLENGDELINLDGKKRLTQIREKLSSMSEKSSCFVVKRNGKRLKVKVSNKETVFIKKQFSLSFAENLTETQQNFGKSLNNKENNLENIANTFNEIVEKRKSFRVFDTENHIPDEVVRRSLERAILSPNSSNMQLWEFYIVKKEVDKKALANICMKQSGAKTASQMVVFVCRPDNWQKRQKALVKNLDNNFKSKDAPGAKGAYQYYEQLIPLMYNTSFAFVKDIFKKGFVAYKGLKEPFVRDVMSKDIPIVANKSVALAAQTFMLSISAEGYDSLPMEGFDSKRLKQFLNLPKTASICMVVSVGKGKPEGLYGPRFRLPYEDVVFDV